MEEFEGESFNEDHEGGKLDAPHNLVDNGNMHLHLNQDKSKVDLDNFVEGF